MTVDGELNPAEPGNTPAAAQTFAARGITDAPITHRPGAEVDGAAPAVAFRDPEDDAEPPATRPPLAGLSGRWRENTTPLTAGAVSSLPGG